ncbi:MarR family winged helix-turn-helix transcriptional regulator [Methylobrevis albus]|uniref:MarR family transcriptional regulator n=1 Tax=Methylobrevis albus TaxID=2793297 RepID=A0A931I5D2_9HYPH|nr:MarR family transcriptional regulator [Methylobrevis albus]MBH0239525.1 MarR family transcriptional regulator [Methylobrevis albus]
MSFNHRKSVTFRLTQAARAHRTRAGVHLGRIGLHPGQEAVLKALADDDGRSMSELAAILGVQPPTVTKMIARLGAQDLVRRESSASDGRLARVYLTDVGRERVDEIDRAWRRIEKEAMAGLDDKDRKRLRKMLRAIEKNLAPGTLPDDDPADADEPEAAEPAVHAAILAEAEGGLH